jgi:hypothetical protein
LVGGVYVSIVLVTTSVPPLVPVWVPGKAKCVHAEIGAVTGVFSSVVSMYTQSEAAFTDVACGDWIVTNDAAMNKHPSHESGRRGPRQLRTATGRDMTENGSF